MATHDPRTKNHNLALPHPDNYLQDDEQRLEETINKLDEIVATIAADGKLDPAQLPDNAAKVDDKGILLPAQLPANVVTVDANVKIPLAQLPAAAVTNTFDASSDPDMFASQATLGDICNRLDLSKFFMLVKLPKNVRANWRELPGNLVTSINGRTGDLTDVAMLVTNADGSTSLNVSGPLRLKSKAADAYDAVTLSELQTIQAVGGGGATMSGVMNNFIGAVEWFNGSRSSLPAGYIAADGQFESRTDAKTADLWEAVRTGLLTSVSDADWLVAPGWKTQVQKTYLRGSYSTGNGSSTFRVPDLNGMQPDSVHGLFLRGAGKTGQDGLSPGTSGTVRASAAPNIEGEVKYRSAGTVASAWDPVVAMSGAFVDGGQAPFGNATMMGAGPNNAAMSAMSVKLDAQKSDDAYGRDVTAEVRPNSAVGIWIIRANGSFAAPGTQFKVIASDKARPAAGTQVGGGELQTEYWVNGKQDTRGYVRVNRTFPKADGTGGKRFLRIGIQADDAAKVYNSFDLNDDGSTEFRGNMTVGIQPGKAGIPANGLLTAAQLQSGHYIVRDNSYQNKGQARIGCYATTSLDYRFEIYASEVAATNLRSNIMTVDIPNLKLGSSASGGGTNAGTVITLAGDLKLARSLSCGTINSSASITGASLYSPAGTRITSDANLKENIQDAESGSLERIEQIRLRSYDWKKGGHVEVGVIAQELEAIAPRYVCRNDKGVMHYQESALVLDLIGAVQALTARVQELEGKLAS